MTLQLTQGVVKNIIPAIASTNAIVAASCALETLKLVTLASTGLNNYLMYVRMQGNGGGGGGGGAAAWPMGAGEWESAETRSWT